MQAAGGVSVCDYDGDASGTCNFYVHHDTMRMLYTALNGVAYEIDIALHEAESDQVISKGT